MFLRRLEIERFRGIHRLDWRHIGTTSAIVGAGDSGKSTILDAIERALSPRWTIAFDDTDFWELKTDKPIVIRVTLTNLPEIFYRDTKFGLKMQAFDEEKGTARPPSGEEDEEHAIVIELRVDSSLEPEWIVIDGEGDEHTVRPRDREALGMVRVGSYVNSHFNWSRGSILTRLTEGRDTVGEVLAEATRLTRSGLKKDGLEKLAEAATAVEQIGKELGVAPTRSLAPHIDVGSFSYASGSLSLHDGEVPVRRAGLGTRRLLAVAMQRQLASDHGLTIVDEFEHGLEPHRIRRLIRVLRGMPPEEEKSAGQLLLTTHSPAVLSELSTEEVFVTHRSADGDTVVRCLPEELTYVLPRVPGALLAEKVIVVEGATEEGFIQALDEKWTVEENGSSFSYRGVAVVDGGGGTQPAEIAGHLSRLGFTVALFVDSDAKAKVGRADRAEVLRWADSCCTESRIAQDLPIEGVRQMCCLAAASPRSGSPRFVRDALADSMDIDRSELDESDPNSWIDSAEEWALRKALGEAAHKKGWFKKRELGRQLGKLVIDHWEYMALSPTVELLNNLRGFVHGD